jgi:hypothetical protein
VGPRDAGAALAELASVRQGLSQRGEALVVCVFMLGLPANP